MWHPMRWCSSSAVRIFIADPFPKDARCGQLARRLLSNSLARKFTRKMAAPALSPRLSILRACSARISSLGGMCLVSLSAVCLGGVEVRRSQCPHWLGALRTRTPRHLQQLRRLFSESFLSTHFSGVRSATCQLEVSMMRVSTSRIYSRGSMPCRRQLSIIV